MKTITLLTTLLLSVGSAGCATLGEAAGPWRGQVIDAETSQPVEGVVVLAVWESVRPGMMHVARDFHDVDEVITDAEGRFVLPARSLTVANPFVTIEGPKLSMFKGGYGPWGVNEMWKYMQMITSFRDAMKRFGEGGAIFDLPPLKTRDERRRFLSRASPPFDAPSLKIPRYLDAIDTERLSFGMEPIKDDRLKYEKERKEIGR
jgi:hypothetical protein